MTMMFPDRVGVIKHLGHHNFDLTGGKDTTTHYEHGAECVAGVDAEKTVLTLRNNDLDKSLQILCDLGMQFAIIEGFKDYGFKKIVKGELESGECILRDPEVDDVIASLDAFDDYYTTGGLVKELETEEKVPVGASIITFSRVFENGPKSCGHEDLAEKIRESKGIISLKIAVNGKKLMIAVATVDTTSACDTIEKAVSNLAT